MNKACAKCEKTVFPMEELKCLDKTWHKGCFKCHECGMTLNMKTYKGFNKLPYCEAHIPKAKATTVAETPELKRIQENTKIQSNAAYHAEFEKAKGKFTPVVDDPESLRIKQNTKIISNVAYHGDLEKKAQMEQRRTLTGEDGDHNSNGIAPPKSPSYMDELSSVPTPQGQQRYGQPQNNSSSAYNNRASNNYGMEHKPSQQQQYHSAPAQQQQYHQPPPAPTQQYHQAQQQQQHHPIQNNPSPYSSRGSASANVIYTSSGGGLVNAANNSRQPGSIADYDPVNNYFGSLDPAQVSSNHGMRGHGQAVQSQSHNNGRGGGNANVIAAQNNGRIAGAGQQQVPTSHHGQQQQQHNRGSGLSGVCYRALYDYEAQDTDEVSFMDGDSIIDCTPIDEGWLTGTVQRTGMRGMLPANYVAAM